MWPTLTLYVAFDVTVVFSQFQLFITMTAVASFVTYTKFLPALGMLVMFMYNKKITFTYLVHMPYVIYPQTSNMFSNLTLNYYSNDNDCECTETEQGPFIGISRPLNGLSNQFHYLHNILLLSYGFEGTIIFPRYASKRIPLQSNDTTYEWQQTTIDTLFDIVGTVRKLRHIGMNVCIESETLKCKSAFLTTVESNFNFAFITRRCWGIVGCFGRHSTNIINRHYNNRTCLFLPNVWGAAPVPHSVAYHTDFLRHSAAISQCISFASNLTKYGRRVYEELLVVANQKHCSTLNVIHLRVEYDWRRHMHDAYNLTRFYSCNDLLDPYDKFLRQHNLTGFVYIAVGNLSEAEKSLVYGWADALFGSNWTVKGHLSIFNQLKHLETDALAVVDHYVISQADEFVGTGVSSMSYIASEMRNFNGLKSWLVLPPGEIFYPLTGSREFVWRQQTVMKLSDSRLLD